MLLEVFYHKNFKGGLYVRALGESGFATVINSGFWCWAHGLTTRISPGLAEGISVTTLRPVLNQNPKSFSSEDSTAAHNTPAPNLFANVYLFGGSGRSFGRG